MSNSDGDLLVLHVDPSNNSVTIMFMNPVSTGHKIHLAKQPDYSAMTWAATEDMPAKSTITIEYDSGTGTLVAETGIFEGQSDISELPGDSFTLWYYAAGWNVTGGFDQRPGTDGGAYTWNSALTSDPIVDLPAPAAGMDWAFFPDLTATDAEIKAAYESGATTGDSYWAQVEDGYDYVPGDPPATNAAPTGTGLPTDVSVTEDTEGPLDLSAIILADEDGDALTLKLTPSAGTLTAATAGGITPNLDEDGVSILLDGTAAALNAYLDGGNVSYTGALNVNGDNAATITASVSDGEDTTALGTINVDITAVNDAPTGDATVVAHTGTEDVISAMSLSGITVNDVDGDILTVQLTPQNGALQMGGSGFVSVSSHEDGVSLLVSGTAADLNGFFATQTATYSGVHNAAGDDVDSVAVSVTDGTETTDLGSIAVHLTPVNDAPTLTGSVPDLNVTEDTIGVPAFSGLTIGDVDGDNVSVVVTASGGAVTGDPGAVNFSGVTLLNAGSDEMTITGPSFGHINTFFAFNGLRYVPEANSTDPATVTVRAGDGQLFSETVSFDVGITPVNDAPTFDGLPSEATGEEDTSLALDLSGLTVADVDGDTLTVTLATDNGRLAAASGEGIATSLSNDEKTVLVTGSATALNAYFSSDNVEYIPDANDAGLDVAEITATLSDADVDVPMGTIAVHLEPENDAPTLSGVPGSFAAVLEEETSVDFSGVTVADIDSDEVTVTIGALNATLSATSTEDVAVEEEFESYEESYGYEEFATYLNLTGTPEAITAYFDTNQISYTAADVYEPTFEPDLFGGEMHNLGGEEELLPIFIEDPFLGDLPPPYFFYDGMDLPEGQLFMAAFDGEDGDDFEQITADLSAPETPPKAVNFPGDQLVVEDVAQALDLGRLAIFDRNDDVMTVTFTASSGTLTMDGESGEEEEFPLILNLGGDEEPSNVVTLEGDTGEILEALAFGSLIFQTDPNSTDAVTITVEATDGTATVTLGTIAVDVESVDDPASLAPDSFDTLDTEVLEGDLFADNGDGADVDVDSDLAVTKVNGEDLATFNLSALSAGVGLTVNADGTFSFDAGGPSEALVAASTGASNTTRMESFTYGTADGEEATVEIEVHGTATSGLLLGTDGVDTITGGAGRNIVRAGDGADTMDGGDGSQDWLDYRGSDAGVRVNLEAGAATGGHAEGDSFTGFERVVGSSHADIIIGDGGDNAIRGGSGNDNIVAGAGNDILRGDGGADFLDGGAGIDTADYSSETERMRVDMRGVATGALGADEDTLLNIERVVAGSGSDTLIGDDLANALKGGDGRDSLIGGGGRDVLVGGAGGDKLRGDLGADALIGEDGDDTFIFRRVQDSNLTHGVDQIRDFVSGEDSVQLDFVDDISAAFIGDAAFSATGVAELRLRDTGDHLQLLGDMNGDGVDEFRLTFLNTETLALSDFS